MTDKLRTVKSFGLLEEGDILTRTENGKYSYTVSDELIDDNDDMVYIGINSTVELSEDYVKELVNRGYLVDDNAKNFVNVFDEIDSLLAKYNKEIQELDETMKNEPACLKVEKETVLRNMKKVLEHLKSLRK